MAPYTYNYVKSVIEGKDGVLLSSEYKNVDTKLKVRCNVCAHIWHPTFYIIQKVEAWCPKCAGNAPLTYDYVKSIIESMDGILLSEYKNNSTKLKVRCNKCNCVWYPIFNNICGKKKWCPECKKEKLSAFFRHDIAYVKNIIEEKGGSLLSSYTNNKTKLKIECNVCKNIWNPAFDKIQQGQWCPNCSLLKSQKQLSHIIKNIYKNYDIKTNYKGFNWLYNKKTNGTQEIDIYIPELKLAIEYDGQQHYYPVCFGGISQERAEANFKRAKYNDRRKNRIIKQHPEDVAHFIRFNYKEKLTKDYVLNKLLEKGVPVVYNNHNQKGTTNEIFTRI